MDTLVERQITVGCLQLLSEDSNENLGSHHLKQSTRQRLLVLENQFWKLKIKIQTGSIWFGLHCAGATEHLCSNVHNVRYFLKI